VLWLGRGANACHRALEQDIIRNGSANVDWTLEDGETRTAGDLRMSVI
jgi:hypothetical protein